LRLKSAPIILNKPKRRHGDANAAATDVIAICRAFLPPSQ
jgi:hypothetical protein